MGPMSQPDPFSGQYAPPEVLRRLLDARGWTQQELATITGRSRQWIIQIMGGKAGITAETAVILGAAFGNSPADWLRLETNYRLRHVKAETGAIKRRAKIYAKFPINDMQRRGWIKASMDLQELESELTRFLRVDSLEDEPPFVVAPKRSTEGPLLTPAQTAWCARAWELAETLQVRRYHPSKLDQVERELRGLAAYPKETRHLPRV